MLAPESSLLEFPGQQNISLTLIWNSLYLSMYDRGFTKIKVFSHAFKHKKEGTMLHCGWYTSAYNVVDTLVFVTESSLFNFTGQQNISPTLIWNSLYLNMYDTGTMLHCGWYTCMSPWIFPIRPLSTAEYLSDSPLEFGIPQYVW